MFAVNLKTYLGAGSSERWCRVVRDLAISSRAIADGRVALAVFPAMALVASAVRWFEGSSVLVGGQDVSTASWGPHTGETAAGLLAELGCRLALVGHAERRRQGDANEVVAHKARQALDAGLLPLVCVGEDAPLDPASTARWVVDQLQASLVDTPPGRLVVAYEPVWAIGADEPAGPDLVRTVCGALDGWLRADPGRAGSLVLYGGSAGPAMLGILGGAVRGLFLGRRVHDPVVLAAMLDATEAL
jgi:triosephosphate isomerase